MTLTNCKNTDSNNRHFTYNVIHWLTSSKDNDNSLVF